MATAAHINQFLSTPRKGLPNEGILRWCHKHPTINKIIEVAAFILGAALIATAVTLGGWAIILGVAGAALVVASTVAFLALESIAPPHHDMKNHAFKPGKCAGGELYYEGDLPILRIDGNNAYQAGKAQGYLLGSAIHEITKRFDTALHTIARQPRAHEIPEFIAKVKEQIPQEYRTEMEGLVEGYNKWVDEQWWPRPKKMTLEDAILLHLMPDRHNLKLGGIERNPFFIQDAAMACTALVDRDPEKGIIFGRLLDWPSLGVTGKYSLIKHTVKGNTETVEVTIPGLVGTLTAMKKTEDNRFICLCMNVRSDEPTEQVVGMPSLFYNRKCLETSNSLADVAQFRNQNKPLVSYLLTVADEDNGETTNFSARENRFHWYRNPPLATFNCGMHRSKEREEMFQAFYRDVKKDMDHEKLVETTLSLPCINNFETVHKVVMEPGTGTMKVAFDNAFAGDAPLREVPIRKLFKLAR